MSKIAEAQKLARAKITTLIVFGDISAGNSQVYRWSDGSQGTR